MTAARTPDRGTRPPMRVGGMDAADDEEEPMTAKADFNAEEWSTLVEAPLLAAMHVAAPRARRHHP